jgi:UDP-N-acetylglucosamine 3-dehydrogenase
LAETSVGVVGCGRIAGLRHLPVLARLPDVRVAGVADPDAERRDAVADRFGIAHRYGTVAELLDGEALDAVLVCAPPDRHAEVVAAVLGRGKHVLLEKPLCLSLDDADAIRVAEHDSEGRLEIAFNVRRHRLVRRARELVEDGTIGRPVALATMWSSSFDYRPEAAPWRQRRATGGGSLSELVPYHVDVWRYLLGEEIEEISAISHSEPWDDETVALSGRTASGVALAAVATQDSVNANELVLHGTKARLRVDLYRLGGIELQARDEFPGDPLLRLRAAAASAKALASRAVRPRAPSEYEDTYRLEWLHFLDVVHGRAEPECTVEDGVRNLEVVLAASASLGRTVRVADAPRTLAPVSEAVTV